jgi:hypothetical protein
VRRRGWSRCRPPARYQTTDASPVIAEDGAVCFQVEDYATVVTRVETGKGKVALQVWSDE